MNKLASRLAIVVAALLTLASTALAIDQVTLTNGQVVQGKVLNDVPNRHVDIELINGNTKRFERSEVASVDRDVPNRVKDREMFGNDSSAFFSLLAGGAYQFNGGANNNVLFNYGAKIGLNTSQMGDFARLGFALAYDRTTQSQDNFLPGLNLTTTYNDLNFQVLFMRVGNSGLYFGPNIGLAIFSTSTTIGGSSSSSNFEAGAGIGYEAFLTDTFSVGPDVRYEHVFGTPSADYIKFALAGTFHF